MSRICELRRGAAGFVGGQMGPVGGETGREDVAAVAASRPFRARRLHDPVGDLGHLEDRVDLRPDAAKLAASFEFSDEGLQIRERHHVVSDWRQHYSRPRRGSESKCGAFEAWAVGPQGRNQRGRKPLRESGE